MSPYACLVHEAELVGWRVALLIEQSPRPRERASRLSALALHDRDGHVVASASLLHNDSLDLAAGTLIGVIKDRRPS